jgi:hypothetical protein
MGALRRHAPVAKGRPGYVAADVGLKQIVHSGALEPRIAHHEAAGLDDIGGDPEARGHSQHSAGVLRNIGLVKSQAHGSVSDRVKGKKAFK